MGYVGLAQLVEARAPHSILGIEKGTYEEAHSGQEQAPRLGMAD